MLLLKSTDGDGQVLLFPLFKDRLTIGRDPSADIVLTDADVSRFHALLTAERRGLTVSDTQSTNGVFVNCTRIQQPTHLKVGDLLILGSNLFVVAEEDRDDDELAQTMSVQSLGKRIAAEKTAEPASGQPGAFDDTITREKFDLLERAFEKKTQVARFPRLLVTGEGLGEQCFVLAMPTLRIGRASDCHVRLSNAAVSAHHAEIRVHPEGNWLVDLESDGGTRVNGAPIRQHRLRDGDAIDLPGAWLAYRHEEGLRGKVSEFLKWLFR